MGDDHRLDERAPRRAARLLTALTALALLAPWGAAQRLGKSHWEDLHNGYRFRPPDDWATIPPQPDELELGLMVKMEGDVKVINVSGRSYPSRPGLDVLRVAHPAAQGDERQELPPLSAESIGRALAPISGASGLDPKDPLDVEEVKGRGLDGLHVSWKGARLLSDRVGLVATLDVVVDVFAFRTEGADVLLVFDVPLDYSRKWLPLFEKVGRTFEVIERARALEREAGGTYADEVSYQEQLVARTPGWRVVPTPSRKYILKTSSDDQRFVDEVIERLELSRELFERDFPPPAEFDAVSVVRVCKTEEEFHSYGDTPRGVAGWFSPATTELVLYDAKDIDRNTTFAVMSHEAFHQYCFFLFRGSEANRWFDEGHGDYYGCAKFKRGRAEITKHMPAGLDRIGVIKEMINSGTWAPLAEHLTYDHRQWQAQGPSNVSCYAQSWSVVYMLRQGMLGNVPSKLWRPEWAEIVPSYVKALDEGFTRARAELLAEREAEAREEGRELTAEERDVKSDDLPEQSKHAIWDEAFAASWGKIDLERFQESWLAYVKKL